MQWRLRDSQKSGQIQKNGYFINHPIKVQFFFLESYVKDETELLLDINYIPLLQASHCIDSVKCYCIPMDDCFNINMDFHFNNCWLAIDKPRLHNWPLMLEFEAFNQAMLSSNITRYEVHTCTLTYQ